MFHPWRIIGLALNKVPIIPAADFCWACCVSRLLVELSATSTFAPQRICRSIMFKAGGAMCMNITATSLATVEAARCR